MVGKIYFLNDKGHTSVAWDEAKPETVEKARSVIDEYLGNGFAIFDVSAAGAPAKQIDQFDPTLREIGVVRQFQGG